MIVPFFLSEVSKIICIFDFMVWGSPATAEKNQAIGSQRDFDSYFLAVEGEFFSKRSW